MSLVRGAYGRTTPEEFVIKLTKFECLTPAEQQRVFVWCCGYQHALRTSYQRARDSVLHNPEITPGERFWILRSIDYRLHRVQAELRWLDQQIAISTQEEGSDTV